ncbi:MAG: ATP synthase F0 subunit B [Clostridiales bacterium]|nr:ATP synthase F0 subunit B [Clostridiales bacterium]
MNSIFDLLDELEDMLDSAPTKAFSKKISIDRDALFELIGDIRLSLPVEIKQAQRIADNCDKIINDANNKAQSIIKDAEEKCERLISDNEITKKAKEEAALITGEAKDTAREMRIAAVEYADNLLEQTEQSLKGCLEEFLKISRGTEDFIAKEIDIVYNNRQELRGGN